MGFLISYLVNQSIGLIDFDLSAFNQSIGLIEPLPFESIESMVMYD